ncbi:hypothetical protein J6590_059029, partial [Homalodisca vitripennis]
AGLTLFGGSFFPLRSGRRTPDELTFSRAPLISDSEISSVSRKNSRQTSNVPFSVENVYFLVKALRDSTAF